MNGKTEIPSHQRAVEELDAKQRNIVWPDTLRNGKSVDAFLWKGDPDAPLVQRIGAWLFGLFFILVGLGWVTVAYEKRSWLFGILSVGWFLLGRRVFFNGFRKHKAHSSE